MSAPNPNEPANTPSQVEPASQPAAAPGEPIADAQPMPEPAPSTVNDLPPAETTVSAGESPTEPSVAPPPAPSVEMNVELPPVTGSVPLDLPDFGSRSPAVRNDQAIDLLSDVELDVKIELGRANMLIEDVLRLGEGSVVELDKLAGDPVDVFVNDRLVARGEVLVLNDNFCVRISELVAGVEEEAVAAGAT